MNFDIAASSRCQELQRAFDESFAAPRQTAPPLGERLLTIRIAGEAFALPLNGKLARLSGLAVDRPPSRLPGRGPEVLGLVGVNGAILAAFDLGTLVGLPGGAARWLALLRLPAPAALAFEDLERLVEVPAADMLPMASADSEHLGLVTRLVRLDERLVPVLDLDGIAETIRLGTDARRA